MLMTTERDWALIPHSPVTLPLRTWPQVTAPFHLCNLCCIRIICPALMFIFFIFNNVGNYWSPLGGYNQLLPFNMKISVINSHNGKVASFVSFYFRFSYVVSMWLYVLEAVVVQWLSVA